MKQYRIEVTALAEQDLEDVGDYIAHNLLNPSAAFQTVRGIRKKINELQFFPYKNVCDVDPVLNQLGVRTEQFRNYVIYYIINELKQIVYIVRILHSLMDGRNRLKKSLGLE